MICRNSRDEYVQYIEEWSIEPEQFSEEQKKFLFKLNTQLSDIEKEIGSEVARLRKDCQKKLNNPNDWVNDYELECVVTFVLSNEDQYFSDEDDNIIVELCASGKHMGKHKREIWNIADNVNHNKFQLYDHPLKHEHHCWLYYCLYDRTELGWANIFRIGSIWIDVKVEYQTILKVTD
ncbi:hypothetical protein [Oceanimonas smirnovii]|uniref:hypothetical protein n=1 Tax=Oceanimonas smirnovii TaxID=264574 RepID=UPI00035D9751|nr:hypothetical protein [Oceanimonas smirnovii]